MDPVIAVLPANVIDQIAAGEVIERPSSVVKELVDNAIDAGARTITIETAAGGRSMIRVSDDGIGMSSSDAVLALERHATSKIRSVDDLWGLVTMGFRGEALPSIASVSRLSVTTRRMCDLAGTRVIVEAGRLISVTEVGAAPGTSIEVADLLFNLPARLKFLKGEATEASHITDLVGKLAMAHPQLHVKLRHNGRTALEVPPDRDGFARAQALLGARIASRMVPVSGEENGIRVAAYLGAPELAQTTARGVQLFVGRRAIRDRGLLHAVAMGYGELVPRGRYPIAIVLVDAPATAVDINVHPQKLEVRFVDAPAVCAAVRHVVQSGIATTTWREDSGGAGPIQMTAIASVAPPRLPFDGSSATPLSQRYAAQLRDRTSFRPSERAHGSSQASLELDPDRARPTSVISGGARAWVRSVRDRTQASRAAEAIESVASMAPRPLAPVVVADASVPEPTDRLVLAEGSGPRRSEAGSVFFAALRYLGQLDLTYLVCDGDGELVLIDQHAAHERVELARLRANHAVSGDGPGDLGGRVAVQKMLFPVTLDATPAQLELVANVGAVLAAVGFEVEPFGRATLAVKAVPAGIRHGDPAQLLRALLAEWAEDGTPSETERVDRILSEIACHSVLRAGDRISASEAEALLRSLDALEVGDPETPAPHGRPVLLRLPIAEIGRRFGR